LARAKGIPVIPIVGLVFLDNKFYYHAWPAVYVGEWIQMDPTFGQNIADTTHIPFFAGSLEEQARIASLVGRIQIEVIDIVNE
ncbi:transglutaminase domain-containing protein, partial [PVC group bacterium]|nr:transglutaminase domain-containing protein [PVC group bacterium]